MKIEFGKGKHLLISYVLNFYHPDPMFDELTYGEGASRSNMIRKNIKYGSHVFFHTTIKGQRYITAHYFVYKVMEGYDARHDKNIRKKYKNPHIRPENYPEWWGEEYDPNKEVEGEYEDIIIFGDPKKSFGKLDNPLPFNKKLAKKLEFEGNKIKFGIINKNGRIMSDNECITSCTRTPRYITRDDVKFLLREIQRIQKYSI